MVEIGAIHVDCNSLSIEIIVFEIGMQLVPSCSLSRFDLNFFSINSN